MEKNLPPTSRAEALCSEKEEAAPDSAKTWILMERDGNKSVLHHSTCGEALTAPEILLNIVVMPVQINISPCVFQVDVMFHRVEQILQCHTIFGIALTQCVWEWDQKVRSAEPLPDSGGELRCWHAGSRGIRVI